MMKVGLLLFDLYIGGISTYARTLASELEKRGHEVHVITSARESKPSETQFIIHRSKIRAWHQHTPLNLLTMLSLRKTLKEVTISEKLDVVNALSGFTWFSLVPYSNFLLTGVPYCHTIFYKANRYNLLLKPLSEVGIRSLKQSKRVICISKNVQKNLDLRNTVVIHPGVNVQRFLPGKARENTIQFVGSLAPWRGASILAEAMPGIVREIPEAKFEFYSNFDVYGSHAEEYKKILQVVSKNKMEENFGIFGPQKDITKTLSHSEIFAMPIIEESETADIPISIIEAMACAKPVVTTNTGGISELIVDGENGIIVKENTPQQFAEAIVGLVSNKREARRIGSNARKTVEKEFKSEKMAERIESIYLNIV